MSTADPLTVMAMVDRLTGNSAARVVAGAAIRLLVANPRLITLMRPVANKAIVRLAPVVAGTTVDPVDAPLRGEWVRAPAARDDAGVLLVLHGSGYLVCSPRTHRGFASYLSQHSGLPALVVEYPLAPEHTFPAAEDAAMAAYRRLLSQGYDARKVVIAGDSAGGHLAVAVALRAKREGLPAPAALALWGPLIDPSYRAPIVDPRVRRQPFDPRAAARALALYVGDADIADPRLCLLNADLVGLPPIQLHYGTREVMRADAESFAARVTASGGHCEQRVWTGLAHAYWMVPRSHDGSLDSMRAGGEFLRAAVAQPYQPMAQE
ncbi:alpha/beta hydrolase fold domain-containing protein [Mycolicibacterium mucogenicum]|uniref:Alpha/beta hydrolase fold domain-containing protein n=1 Tax=Mycolicibacterium mucogenicum DSM 44124 TaxID=1226753 RepID=A0A8H2JD15_MYCMU|nr:alpha/beta hydrolase fold domain-containing protein [Mycolicibacterium mucogenicum]QPG71540.1 alpha/beta hydrolase fold domain-containing protein [Mycolicibacterium mucogenicum DSM 44124]